MKTDFDEDIKINNDNNSSESASISSKEPIHSPTSEVLIYHKFQYNN